MPERDWVFWLLGRIRLEGLRKKPVAGVLAVDKPIMNF